MNKSAMEARIERLMRENRLLKNAAKTALAWFDDMEIGTYKEEESKLNGAANALRNALANSSK